MSKFLFILSHLFYTMFYFCLLNTIKNKFQFINYFYYTHKTLQFMHHKAFKLCYNVAYVQEIYTTTQQLKKLRQNAEKKSDENRYRIP